MGSESDYRLLVVCLLCAMVELLDKHDEFVELVKHAKEYVKPYDDEIVPV
jgi:hypothetical protein